MTSPTPANDDRSPLDRQRERIFDQFFGRSRRRFEPAELDAFVKGVAAVLLRWGNEDGVTFEQISEGEVPEKTRIGYRLHMLSGSVVRVNSTGLQRIAMKAAVTWVVRGKSASDRDRLDEKSVAGFPAAVRAAFPDLPELLVGVDVGTMAGLMNTHKLVELRRRFPTPAASDPPVEE